MLRSVAAYQQARMTRSCVFAGHVGPRLPFLGSSQSFAAHHEVEDEACGQVAVDLVLVRVKFRVKFV